MLFFFIANNYNISDNTNHFKSAYLQIRVWRSNVNQGLITEPTFILLHKTLNTIQYQSAEFHNWHLIGDTF